MQLRTSQVQALTAQKTSYLPSILHEVQPPAFEELDPAWEELDPGCSGPQPLHGPGWIIHAHVRCA